MKTLYQLKEEGHRLLDEYVSLEHNLYRSGKKAIRHAYDKLSTKVKENQPFHFRDMKTEQTCNHAISKLKKMIRQRKKRIAMMEEKKKYKSFLPREELVKALHALKK